MRYFLLSRDDWKYYDEDAEEWEEEKNPPPPEKQCANCLHWAPRDALSCAWCGKRFDDGGRE